METFSGCGFEEESPVVVVPSVHIPIVVYVLDQATCHNIIDVIVSHGEVAAQYACCHLAILLQVRIEELHASQE